MIILSFLVAFLATVSTTEAVCSIRVPADPLSARGLATPYIVTGCNQLDAKETSFVQGAIYDPATNTISIYNPLMITKGTIPAIKPVVPKLPKGAIVGLWFGSNADTIHLTGSGFNRGRCVNGLGRSDFGQFAACNGDAFFRAARKVKLPDLGTATNGLPCPTVRDFSIVDQDQSDNVATSYIIASTGRLAQNTAENRRKFGVDIVENMSDNGLLIKTLSALGCKPFTAPDLADPGSRITALPLNELMANKLQKAPVALVPIDDPMTLVNGKPNVRKTTLYRRQVNQPPASLRNDNSVSYCKNILKIAPDRLAKDKQLTIKASSPDPEVGNSLFTFLAARLDKTFGPEGLDCSKLLNLNSPVVLTKDAKGVATAARFVRATRKRPERVPRKRHPRPRVPRRRRRNRG
ncbi:hypothetical protein QVD99_005702 [Batrachochytrium dendrobatidis]|nr:hypothetical protein O5D80_000820 [Batrachochytrium dendrobatidis]KAK5667584.1 hypothetical protein QVD99_005702 [Batrachochytrium dendrobatidis]